MLERGRTETIEPESENPFGLYNLKLGEDDLQKKRKEIMNAIYEVSSSIVTILKNDGDPSSKKHEIIEYLTRYPYYYNPVELEIRALKNRELRTLLTRKRDLEDVLGYVEDRIRFL